MTEKGIKVLSLFDGISCGMVALQKANIPVDTYYSSEISIDAITVSENNWCGIIKRLGDVRNWKSWNIDWAGIDLLIGGFPCTNISLAGKREGLNGNESSLFYYYCDIKAHIMKLNPNLKFFVENTIASSCHLHEISNYLGVYPVKIDSCIVSAQNRKRLYWANFGISQPPTKHILLQDIVTSGFVTCEKSSCLTHVIGNLKDYLRSGVASIVLDKIRDITEKDEVGYKIPQSSEMKIPKIIIDKKISMVFKRSKSPDKVYTFTINVPDGVYMARPFNVTEIERLQTLPEGYLSNVSFTSAQKLAGLAWTIDVIAHIFSLIKFDYENN